MEKLNHCNAKLSVNLMQNRYENDNNYLFTKQNTHTHVERKCVIENLHGKQPVQQQQQRMNRRNIEHCIVCNSRKMTENFTREIQTRCNEWILIYFVRDVCVLNWSS